MSRETTIAWTHHTWSPWWGCTKVSPGCEHCYAEGMDRRTGGRHWGPGRARRSLSPKHWTDPLAWNRAAAETGERRRVFPSMCDPFDADAPAGARDRMWSLIRETPALDWLLLTKRPENIPAMLPALWGDGWPNVWLGTSAEDQRRWDERVPLLLAAPAAVTFVSVEPMIGPIVPRSADLLGLDLAIIGGESGPRHRPLAVEWVRALVDACRFAGVHVFVKQDAGPRPGMRGRIPDDLWIQEMPRWRRRSTTTHAPSPPSMPRSRGSRMRSTRKCSATSPSPTPWRT